jgi:hypothetical protein
MRSTHRHLFDAMGIFRANALLPLDTGRFHGRATACGVLSGFAIGGIDPRDEAIRPDETGRWSSGNATVLRKARHPYYKRWMYLPAVSK